MIKENLDGIFEKINALCIQKNIDKNQCKLIAVSKTKPIESIKEAYDYGIRDFGENKVQEIIQKYDKLPKDINWHMIGHLQTNKVKMIIDKVKYIHSVDSLRLAHIIEKEASKKNIIVNVLLELNISQEESKYGFSIKELYSSLETFAGFKHIRVVGLMTVAPFVYDANENRDIFRKMKQILLDINNKNIDNILIKDLSMGMSGDFLVAIEEGATFIRIGTMIFGDR